MIRNYNLLRSILAEPWLLTVSEAEKLHTLMSGVFSPNLEFEPINPADASATCFVQQVRMGDSKQVHGIGVVRMIGVLTKYDALCSYGMESYAQMIRRHESSEAVSAIVLHIDSPGGTVVGTEELSDVIRACSKPVVAFVSDLAGSAAYWLAAGCCEIIANNSTARVGSIGVVCTYCDVAEYYAKQGIKFRDILPEQSKHKREQADELAAGKDDSLKKELGVLAEKFQAAVRVGRPNVTDEQLTGRSYFAKDVLGSLVDSVGSFEEVLARAAELAQEDENAQNNDNMMKNNQLTNLAKAAGVAVFESADGSINLTADMAEAVDRALGGGETTPTTEPEPEPEAVVALRQQLAEAQTQNAAQAQQIAELSKAPGATGAAVAPATDALDEGAPQSAQTFAEACAEAKKYI